MIKSFLMVMLWLCLGSATAQAQNSLTVGDTIPKINVTVLEGDSLVTKPLSSFYERKYLIIDFWANWCGACIRAMTSADSVAQHFKEKLLVLPVTYQDANTTKKFVENNIRLKNLEFSYVVNDSVLMGGYFKFVTLPHEVWVDSSGIVRAITYADNINKTNIDLFLKNELKLPQKNDDLSFDLSAPLKVDDDSILFRSVLTHYKPGLQNMIGSLTPPYLKSKNNYRFLAVNKDILSMFYAAFSQSNGNINYGRIEIKTKQLEPLSPWLTNKNPERELVKRYEYCYEMIYPEKVTSKFFYNNLMHEFNKLFAFKATVEKRKKMCWVIVNKNKTLNPRPTSYQPKLVWDLGFIKRLENQTMDVLTDYLNWNMDLPVVDETTFAHHFDMDIDVSAIVNGEDVVLDINRVRASLKKYGFDIIKAIRPVDVLVIRDKKIED